MAHRPTESGRLEPPEPLRRFYTAASVAALGDDRASVVLDGRPLRTPARETLTGPRRIADAVAAEWNAQGEHILPLTMPLTRLVNSAIDGVARAVPQVQADIAAIASNDLVIYRADAPEGLVCEQDRRWNQVVRHGEERTGVRIVLASGIMPIDQDPLFAERVRTGLPTDPLALAAVHQFATLTGSALLALAFADGRLTFDEAWAAAHVDEDWNVREWGEDAEAAARRALRRRDAEAAAFVLRTD